MQSLCLVFQESSRRYRHLCPLQGLGARMPLLALGYQVIPVKVRFCVQAVKLNPSLGEIISKPHKKAQCEIC